MATDYMKLIRLNHPATEASCLGDSTVYSNITFHSASVAQATLDAEWLPVKKADKNLAIDLKTQELISAGFVFDSQTFSLTLEAQTQWTTLKTQEAYFTWPMDVSTKDDGQYSLTAANLTNFWLTGLGTVKAHLDSGRALKQSVNAAVDEAGVDGVVDGR